MTETAIRIAPGRGHFETMRADAEEWEVSGWILHPDVAATAVRARLDGEPLGESAPGARDDVGRAFRAIPHAAATGFRFRAPRRPGSARLEVECLRGGEVLVRISTTLSDAFLELPTPPAELMRRVTGSPDAEFFLADGVRSFTEFVDAVVRHRDLERIGRMLDWGCGCGRLARLFLRAYPALEVHGCDIDAEAVGWCREQLEGGEFRAVPPMPPTDYPDGAFDLVVGYSVLSHLLPDAQRAWLAEIRRLLAPGGLFLGSVHGTFAARFAFEDAEGDTRRGWPRRDSPLEVLRKTGFLDKGADGALEGIAPEGYYRGVFQTPEWTRRVWSPLMPVLEIREAGMQNYQDLVILARP